MIDKAQLDKAISAHGLWKARIRNVIDTGKSEIPVTTIEKDDQCEFGKWLYSIPPADRTTENYKIVKGLHAEFHGAAAKVVKLVLAGKTAEAKQMLELKGDYTAISAKLTNALMEWKKA